jgi:uncharacterized membrane protein
MTLAPLLNAPYVIQIHTAAALLAVVLTIPQLTLRKGGPRHRAIGLLFVATMVVVCLTSFFIHEIGWPTRLFSPIHLLSIVTLATLVLAIRAARRGDIAAHQRMMLLLVFSGLFLAGLFTFVPGRIMHDVFFGV